MKAKEVVELANILSKTTPCQQKCKLDIWRERCVSCNRTINQIKEAYERSKYAS